MSQQKPHVIIIGAGFGGLRTARELRNAPVDVTLIDKHNYHLFQPLLYQVATAGLAPEEIAYPIRAIFRKQKNLKFLLDEVTHVDLQKRLVHTSTKDLNYDYLVIAIGGETNYFGIKSVAEHALGLKTLNDSVELRNHVLNMFEKAVHETDPAVRRALLTFVVVGGGPTGVESAGALSELIRLVLIKDYPSLNIKDVRILLLEALDLILASFPDALREFTSKTLWNKHIEIRFGASVEDFNGKQVSLKGGEVIPACTLIWTAGIRTASLADSLGLRQGRQGRLIVEKTLQQSDHPEVFVIGDASYLEDDKGKPFPMVATVAIQQGRFVAKNIVNLINGIELQTFVYDDPGLLATIGRSSAVAKLGRFEFGGIIAWLLWSVVHVYQLIGFRNRIMVLIYWAWDYFLYNRAVRLILPTKGDHE